MKKNVHPPATICLVGRLTHQILQMSTAIEKHAHLLMMEILTRHLITMTTVIMMTMIRMTTVHRENHAKLMDCIHRFVEYFQSLIHSKIILVNIYSLIVSLLLLLLYFMFHSPWDIHSSHKVSLIIKIIAPFIACYYFITFN